MGDKKGREDEHISRICEVNGLDKEDIQKKAERFLEINHEMRWNRAIYVGKNVEEKLVRNEGMINKSISYLANLDWKDCDVEIEKNLKPLYDSCIINDILNYAFMKMRQFPYGGELYYDIIRMTFLELSRYTSEDIMDRYAMCRAVFYRKRKDATILFGIVLWSIAIPFLQENFNCSVNEFKSLLKEAGSCS